MAIEPIGVIQDLLAGQGAPASQLHRIAALHSLFERSPQCLAVAMVGSYAQGSGDRISDLDLAAFVEQGGARAFINEAHGVLSGSDLLNDYFGEHVGRGFFHKYVYLDFSSCELHAFEVPTTFKLRRPFLAVWDPGDFLERLVVEGAPPRHEDFDAYQHGDDGLIWELVDCIKWLKRGRHQLTKDYLRKLVALLDRPARDESPGA